MKKILFFAAVAALSAMVSCQKEEAPSQKEAKPIVFSASIAAPSGTKVSVDTDDGKVSWVAGDEITITYGTYTGVYKADNAGETTTFTYVSGTEFTESGNYSATYGTMPTAGVDQAYSATAGKLIYMTAPSTSTSATEANFTFTAQCGLLKLNLTAKDETYIKRIYVIDESGNAYKLLCETARSIEGGRDFYIALPAGTYTKYIIRDSDGYEAVKTVKSDKTGTQIVANQINKVTFSSLTFNTPIYPESNTAGTKVAGYWWAPVNCGYDATNYEYGKLYQWGRKYGQGYNNSTVVDGDYPGKSGGSQSIEDISSSGALTSHPDGADYNGKFYKGQSNWYSGTSPALDDLWGATKTSYDPCPTGWRVPTYNELNALTGNNGGTTIGNAGWTKTNKGYWFNGSKSPKKNEGLFLLAAGTRDYSNGNARDRESFGIYWCSSAYEGYYAWGLYFNSSKAFLDYNRRAFGGSVRCVQE